MKKSNQRRVVTTRSDRVKPGITTTEVGNASSNLEQYFTWAKCVGREYASYRDYDEKRALFLLETLAR